jgi:hypothetical protein
MTAALARVPELDARAAVVAALCHLKPALDEQIIDEQLDWLAHTARYARADVAALDAEVERINQAHEFLRRALDIYAQPISPQRSRYTPGRDGWRDYRQAVYHEIGFLLPEDPTGLRRAAHRLPKREHAKVASRRGRAQVKAAVANVLAGIYYGHKGQPPPVRHVDGPWGRLVAATFIWLDLGEDYKKAARTAAVEFEEALTRQAARTWLRLWLAWLAFELSYLAVPAILTPKSAKKA